MIGKQIGPFAVGVLLLLACSTQKDDSLSPAMRASVNALRDLPFITQTVTDVIAVDGGVTTVEKSETTTNFGDTDFGAKIVESVGGNGATGNGPGNGGTSVGNGPGNGGVGNGTGPGGGGVGSSNGAGSGGVASGLSFGNTGELAAVVCDFVSALCVSISKCDSGEVDINCTEFERECLPKLTEALAHVEKPVVVPPNAISAMRCVSNAIRNSDCLFSKDLDKSFASKIQACGLPMNESKAEPTDDDNDNDRDTTSTAGTPTTGQ